MAKAVYILCCESQTVDAETGQVSHFNVLNAVQVIHAVIKIPSNAPRRAGTPWLRFTASSTWMAEDGDVDRDFEYSVAVRESDGSLTAVGDGKLKFTRPFHRLDSHIQGHPFEKPGIAYIEAKIRPVGAEAWIEQKYPIIVEVIGQPEPDQNTPG